MKVLSICILILGICFLTSAIKLFVQYEKTEFILTNGQLTPAIVSEINYETGTVIFNVLENKVEEYMESDCNDFEANDTLQVFFHKKYAEDLVFANEPNNKGWWIGSLGICFFLMIIAFVIWKYVS